MQSYLPSKDGKVVAGCFTTELNPQAPTRIYPGRGPQIESRARQVGLTKPELPIFIKKSAKKYEFVGMYRATAFHQDPESRKAASAETGRNDISGVLIFEPI